MVAVRWLCGGCAVAVLRLCCGCAQIGDDPVSTYINANWVTGFPDHTQKFIAAMGAMADDVISDRPFPTLFSALCHPACAPHAG